MINISNITESFDNLTKSINNNKITLILIIILLGIYYAFHCQNIIHQYTYIFDNDIFKFTIFIIITYISSLNPIIGISLAIIMLASLQLITYIKLKSESNDDLNNYKLHTLNKNIHKI